MTQPTPSAPNPGLIFDTLNAYQRTAALKAGIELNVFTAIGEGVTTAKDLATRCQATERGIRILCDYLTIVGLLQKSGSRYQLTPDSAMFLDRRSPACMASAVRFIGNPELTRSFDDLAAVVRKGSATMGEDGSFGPDNAMWVEFARSMVPLMAPAAEAMAGIVGAAKGEKWKVLDIAAGHGIFGVTLARHNPNAEIVAVDWPNVLAVAEENAQKAGIAGRFRKLPGSAFDVDLGTGYDLALLTNILHHFDVATCEKMLRKVRAALKPQGRAVTLEFVPNEDRVSPPGPAAFSMMMLGGTHSGDAYTFPELEGMFRRSGFSRVEIHQPPNTMEQVLVSYC
jgi:hypothetical protein